MTFIIVPPPEPPRREIKRDGVRYREVRDGDDASGWEILGIFLFVLFVIIPIGMVVFRFFFLPMMGLIMNGCWSWQIAGCHV